MANRDDLKNWIIEALEFHGGKRTLLMYISISGKFMNQNFENQETYFTCGNMTCVGRLMNCKENGNLTGRPGLVVFGDLSNDLGTKLLSKFL